MAVTDKNAVVCGPNKCRPQPIRHDAKRGKGVNKSQEIENLLFEMSINIVCLDAVHALYKHAHPPIPIPTPIPIPENNMLTRS